MRELVLRANGLGKSYGKTRALDDIDLTVYRGDICGIIGRNGAGKTTMLKIFSGLITEYNGSYEMLGVKDTEAGRVRYRTGSMIDTPTFFTELTAYQNLKYFCIQKGIADDLKIDYILRVTGLSEDRDKKFKSMSMGMKQRLAIAFALIDEPELVFLDEPVNALDPMGISSMRELFRQLNSEFETTFVISNHILTELYSLANRFVILDQGKIIKQVTKQELKEQCKRGLYIRCDDVRKTTLILENELGLNDYKIADENRLIIYRFTDTSEIVKTLVYKGVRIYGVQETGISLEDYYKSVLEENSKNHV